ncbi:hypothetical protein ACE1B6_11250 [Aerosakkonemataceae cyanobacterium BLCC-F154]|uniref:Uncharacterized protein n=1 Tax=Floridaenema fluviatile BLCC-F154 TaxID=3153640 RepID=A0ABV4YC50_9CYAN
MVSDISNTVREITKMLSPISWRWDKNFWHEIAISLNLTEQERVKGRITYSFPNNQELSAYFDSRECLERIEVPIAVYWEPEFLTYKKYEKIIKYFFNLYEQAVNTINSILGNAQFNSDVETARYPEDFNVLKIAVWNIQNARFTIYVEDQDREVPIIMAIGVEE